VSESWKADIVAFAGIPERRIANAYRAVLIPEPLRAESINAPAASGAAWAAPAVR
jgi:hypothetical protein